MTIDEARGQFPVFERSRMTLKSPARASVSSGSAKLSAKTAARRSSPSGMRQSGTLESCRFATVRWRSPVSQRTAWQTRRSFAHASRIRGSRSNERACSRRKRRGLRTIESLASGRSRDPSRIAFA